MIIINPDAISPSPQIIGWQGGNLPSDYLSTTYPVKYYGVLLKFYTLLFSAVSELARIINNKNCVRNDFHRANILLNRLTLFSLFQLLPLFRYGKKRALDIDDKLTRRKCLVSKNFFSFCQRSESVVKMTGVFWWGNISGQLISYSVCLSAQLERFVFA